MTTKKNIFDKGISKVANTILPRHKRWRMLYNTMHDIEELYIYGPSPALQGFLYKVSDFLKLLPSKTLQEFAKDLPELELIYNFEKLNLLQYQRGNRIKNIARLITFNMINTIMENDDELTVWNYSLLNEQQRMNFIAKTLTGTHKKISQIIPSVSGAVQIVTLDTEYNKHQSKQALAYYCSTNKKIGICPDTLSDNDINSVLDTMAHEYTHALQSVYKSALPTIILQYSWEYIYTLHKLPHERRTIEKEAKRVGKLVSKNFKRHFDNALFDSEKYASYSQKFTPPHPQTERD